MKSFFIITFGLILTIFQSIPEINPELGSLIDKSKEGEIEFIEWQKQCELVWAKLSDLPIDSLNKEDRHIFDNCDEEFETYWDVMGVGCSWYCGGGMDTLSSSSQLKSHKGITYDAKNAHDLSFKTAWVEGAKGYGIGESLTYHFPPESPRITKIIIANGYIKSEKAWNDNSRVKKLKMYLNEKPFAILNLKDSRHEQIFEFEPIGESNRENLHEINTNPWWTMTFEIMEVYKGDKYKDTAISELYFDGIDVH